MKITHLNDDVSVLSLDGNPLGDGPERLAAINSKVLARSAGDYPWDHWRERALEQGIDQELATLGRSVMREAFQHQWGEDLMEMCGLNDGGDAMLKLAQTTPEVAKESWGALLASDGGKRSY